MGAEMSLADCGTTRKTSPLSPSKGGGGGFGRDLEFTPLGVAGARHLAASAPFKMRELHLRHASLGDAGIAVLAAVLPGSSVQVLDLRGNDISPTGAKTLASILPKTNVTDLLLSGNSIRDEGLKALCQAIPNMDRLEVLDISCNHISAEGARHLATSLPQFSWLRELSVAHNDLGQSGAGSLVRALKGLNGGAIGATNLAKVDIRNVGLAPLDSVQLEGLVRGSRGRFRVLGLLPSAAAY